MLTQVEGVSVTVAGRPSVADGEGNCFNNCVLRVEGSGSAVSLTITADEQIVGSVVLTKEISHSTQSPTEILILIPDQRLILSFPPESRQDATIFTAILGEYCTVSTFTTDRDSGSVAEYFKYYALLSQQQNMLTDHTRTGTYYKAVMDNAIDFKDKVVCDVGAGTAILSFFAAQAGARKVYAIEASDMATCAKKLVKANGLEDVITVIQGRCEEVDLPEPVDIIISEPMGVMLVNERMLESFIAARRWLAPNGRMFPSTSSLYVCPFSDDQVHAEVHGKSHFWYTDQFFGVDLSPLQPMASSEYLRQPLVEQVDPRCLVGTPVAKAFDFGKMPVEDLHEFTIPLRQTVTIPTRIHGIASWFDVAFRGSKECVWLSTAPQSALTHWYQVRCLLDHALFVPAGSTFIGKVTFKATAAQSYHVHIEMQVEGTKGVSTGFVNLKEPNFRFGQAVSSGYPSEYYFEQGAEK